MAAMVHRYYEVLLPSDVVATDLIRAGNGGTL